MRDVINKSISTEELLGVAELVYSRGWRLIKLYFMIGLPTETDEDIVAIAELVERHFKSQAALEYPGLRERSSVGEVGLQLAVTVTGIYGRSINNGARQYMLATP